MLSYTVDEAEELLSSKLSTAKKSLSNCEEDLDFLREQITVRLCYFECGLMGSNMGATQTMEVAIARVYNWEVVQKRLDKENEEKSKTKTKGEESSPND